METAAPETKQLSTWQWVVLSALPIVLAVISHMTIRPLVEWFGLPPRYESFVRLSLLFELGFVIYLGIKLSGRLTLKDAVRYREALPWWWYPVGFVVFLALGFGIMALSTPLATFLRETVFAGVSASTTPVDPSLYSQPVLIGLAIGTLIQLPLAAVIEELYFRGTLLPRMEGLGWWAPVISAISWAATHAGQPWDIPGLALMFLPMIFFTKWKKNVYLITLIHGVSNVFTAIAIAAQAFGGAS